MKKKISLATILALMFFVTNIYAESIKLKTAVKIDTLEVNRYKRKGNGNETTKIFLYNWFYMKQFRLLYNTFIKL